MFFDIFISKNMVVLTIEASFVRKMVEEDGGEPKNICPLEYEGKLNAFAKLLIERKI